MSSKKYQIAVEDYDAAHRYISNRFSDDNWLEQVCLAGGDVDIKQVYLAFCECQSASALTKWAESYITSRQWKNLKMAIRNSRRKNRGTIIEINDDAYRLLKEAQSHTGMTFSELIIEIGEIWEEEREKGLDR